MREIIVKEKVSVPVVVPQRKPYAEELREKKETSLNQKQPEVVFVNLKEGVSGKSEKEIDEFQVVLQKKRSILKIRNIRETKKGLVIVAEDKQTTKVISDSLYVGKTDLKVDPKRRRHSMIIVYDRQA